MIELIPFPAGDIHEQVSEFYAQRVRSGDSCCGSDCCAPGSANTTAQALYSAAELELLPAEVSSASFGCGNPMAIASLAPGEVVLDLGSGSGLDCMLAAHKVGPTGYVYGVDMTDEMLELARANAHKANVANVEFRKGQIEAIPLADASVHAIISNCVINLSPDKPQVLAEAHRVLKPGGRFAVSDIVIDGRLDDLPVSEAQVRAALSWAGCIAGALTIDEYRTLLTQAGFSQVDVAIAHRYSLSDLNAGDITGDIPHAVAEELATRFVSASVTAWKTVVGE